MNQICIWDDKGHRGKKQSQQKNKDSEDASLIDFSLDQSLVKSDRRDAGAEKEEEELLDFNSELPSLPTSLSSPPQRSLRYISYLDDEGLKCIEYFQLKVSKLITICPDKHNYLVKTYMPLAMNNKSIQLALAAYGSVFMNENPDNLNYKGYLKRATKVIQSSGAYFENITKSDFYILLCFFLIMLGTEVCSGDTHYAPIFLEQCKILIRNRGGISKVILEFEFSNSMKWLLSNIQYHDILSSRSALKGCELIDEYNDVFKHQKLLDTCDYGIDPFQGSIQPIYLILGGIINESVKLRHEWRQLEEMSNNLEYGVIKLKEFNENLNKIFRLRQKFFEKIETLSLVYSEKISRCQPNGRQFASLLDENEILDDHVMFFNLFRLCCRLYLNNNIRRLPPSSSEQQGLLYKALNIIDEIIDTRLVTCMGFPLVICGMECVSKIDRVAMIYRIERYMTKYKAKNPIWICNIIEDVWVMNPDGNLCLDWAEVVKDMNWDVFLS